MVVGSMRLGTREQVAKREFNLDNSLWTTVLMKSGPSGLHVHQTSYETLGNWCMLSCRLHRLFVAHIGECLFHCVGS